MKWKERIILFKELYPVSEEDGRSSPKMNGLRSRMAAMQAQSIGRPSSGVDDSRLPLRSAYVISPFHHTHNANKISGIIILWQV